MIYAEVKAGINDSWGRSLSSVLRRSKKLLAVFALLVFVLYLHPAAWFPLYGPTSALHKIPNGGYRVDNSSGSHSGIGLRDEALCEGAFYGFNNETGFVVLVAPSGSRDDIGRRFLMGNNPDDCDTPYVNYVFSESGD